MKIKEDYCEVVEDNEPKPTDKQIGGNHYKNFAIQPTVFNEANQLPWSISNIIKYITRWRLKNGLEDLNKVKHYCDLRLQNIDDYGLVPYDISNLVIIPTDYCIKNKLGELESQIIIIAIYGFDCGYDEIKRNVDLLIELEGLE